jgi:trk/ktr system potassium uptake protein
MHVVIAGCGRVGSDLTVSLAQKGHTVSVIDKNAHAFERLPPGFEGQTLVGIVFDRETLEAAGIKEAGAFVAVTNGDNSNIVSARIAREHYGIKSVVARIYDPRRAEIYRRIGIPTVATVQWASAEIYDQLFHGIEHTELAIGDGDMVLLRLEVPKRRSSSPSIAWAARRSRTRP